MRPLILSGKTTIVLRCTIDEWQERTSNERERERQKKGEKKSNRIFIEKETDRKPINDIKKMRSHNANSDRTQFQLFRRTCMQK